MKNDPLEEKVTFGVVSDRDEEWKQLPEEACGYEVSSSGKVRNSFTLKLLKQYEWKTTKGTYLYVYISKTKYATGVAVHQLVCHAFHGNPPNDGKRYEPNHKDGDKHNNHKDNLEWVTRSQNVLHAFKTGLCKVGTRVLAKDILTKTEKKYTTLSEFARDWNIPRYVAREIVNKYQQVPYKSQWIFQVDNTSEHTVSRYQRNEIACKDYRDGQILITPDAASLASIIGENSGTIRSKVRKYNQGNRTLFNGYIFKPANNYEPWPEFTSEEIEKSKQIYQEANGKNSFRIGCYLKDYRTGFITQHHSGLSAAKEMKISLDSRHLSKILRNRLNNNELSLFCGYVVKKESDDRSWPVFSQQEIDLSVLGLNKRQRAISVTDTHLNTTKIYTPVSDFAREIGFNPDRITNAIRECKKDLFHDRYKISFLN